MKVIKAVKKIAAITTAFSMVGATIMGAAAAADLSQYPAPFVTNGVYNGYLVVGDKAAAEDVVGAIDVQSSLQVASVVPAGKVSGSGVSVQGDVAEISDANDLLEIYERIGDVRETLTDSFLDGLRSGVISTDEGVTDYNQYLRFEDGANAASFGQIASGKVVFEQNDDDKVGHFLFFKEGEVIFEYQIEFEEGAESEIDFKSGTSGPKELSDLEDEEIVILGVPFTIVDTTITPTNSTANVAGNAGRIELELLGGDIIDTLEEGQTKTYTIDGVDYEVTVLTIPDSAARDDITVKFNINGEITDELEDGETDVLRDGIEIGIREILANEANEVSGGDLVEFYLGANKIEWVDPDFTDSTLSNNEFDGNVEVANENVEDASVDVRGEILTGDRFRISNIKYRLTGVGLENDDVYVEPGHGLAEYLDEPQGMLTDNWDITYQGLHDTGVSIIRFDANGDDEYTLKFTNREGHDISVPFISNEGVFKYGDDDDDLVFIEGNVTMLVAANNTFKQNESTFTINEDDFFVVTDDNDETGFTHIMRYESIDTDDRIITFTDLGTGQNEVIYTGTPGLNAKGDLVVGGNTFDVYISNISVNNGAYNIAVDLDDDGAVQLLDEANIVVDGGGVLDLGSSNTLAGADINITLITLESEFDENGPNDFGGNENISIQIRNATGNEVDLDVKDRYINSTGAQFETVAAFGVGGGTLANGTIVPIIDMQSISDEDLEQGLSLYGVFLEQTDDDEDAEELIIEYPLSQRGGQVFVEIGDTIVTGGGEGGAASIVNPIQVGSAKLASEVKGKETSQNLIVVGGPCINAVAAKLMGSDEPLCGEASGIASGTGIIKLYENGGKVAVVVAGYSAEDTRRATTVLADYKNYKLSGMEVEVTGTSMSDITVSAPSN